jgi:sterol desaturase/sphingolipid hydroxylase (fatty acid hydroxylase superfamily)
VVLIEIGYDWVKNRKKRDFKESLADLGVYIVHELVGRLTATIVFLGVLSWIARFSLFQIPINTWSWLALFFLTEFMYYWTHRLEHRSRLFWSWHSVHHSSTEFNASTALRLAWLEPLVSWYVLVPIVLVGFDVVQAILMFQILLTYQTWIHSKKIPHLGAIEKIFNSASSHRVHHGSNPRYLDKNFGAVLIIWDRMFGTYEPETEPVVYGLTEPIGTKNPVLINTIEPKRIAEKIAAQESWIQKLRWIFAPPG